MAVLAAGQLHGADYAVLVGYFVLMLGIGAYFYRFMRGMKDYFSGGNRIPWWLSGASFYMSSFSVFTFVFYSGLAFKYGWVAITLYWVTVPATLFSVLLFAKRWRRARIDSPVEYLETRYGAGLRQLFTWQGVPVIMVDDAFKLIAIGTFFAVGLQLPEVETLNILGLEIPLKQLGLHEPVRYTMLATGLIMLLYTLMGGLWGVAVTDFIQFVVMAVAVLALLPLSMAKADGVGSFIDNAPEGFFGLTNSEYNWGYVGLVTVMYCLAWSSVKWPLIQRYYCVRDEREAQKVGWFVVVLNFVVTPLMLLPAMAARHFLPLDTPDKNVYPELCILLLPAGMLGLVIAAMFAATMSMLSSDYNACAGVLTNDVYRRLVRKDATQRQLVVVGRLMTLLIGIFALGVAFLMSAKSGEGLFRAMITLFGVATAPVAVPMILGLLSKRVTNVSAIAGFFCGLVVGLGLYLLFYHALPDDKETPILGMMWNPEKNELLLGGMPLKMEVVLFGCNSLATLIAMLVASIAKPMGSAERERVAAFRQRLETPIGQLEEDTVTAAAGTIISPFRVVGVAVLLIGAMMLCILPWVEGGLAFGLDLAFGIVLLIIGGLMFRRSGSTPDRADAE